MLTKHGKASLQRFIYRWNKHDVLCYFSLLIIKELIVKTVNQEDTFTGAALFNSSSAHESVAFMDLVKQHYIIKTHVAVKNI